jgi:amino acid adenylation domain-containing protein
MSNESVQEMFSRMAAVHEVQVAIERSGRRVTYGELEREANRLGNYLRAGGVGRGTMVGLLAGEPSQIISGILGVLKAGAVFVPLDPTFPDGRLQVMNAQVQPEWYVVEGKYLEKLSRIREASNREARVICLDSAAEGTEASYASYDESGPTGVPSDPDAPCSVYFTSGSTGKPKAILGRLKGIDHFMRWEIEAVGATAGTRVSQLASPSFDGFLKDAFVPLCAGGVVCAPESRDVILDAGSLADWLDVEQVEVLHCVPSVFRSLINEGLNSRYFEAMKYVVLTGEPLYPADVKRWLEVFGERIKLLNIYGTTETSLSKFAYEVKAEDVERPSIPVGKPIKGAAVMIMDSASQPCHEGAVGEIHIRTPYRSFGYYGDPDLTEAVLIQNPFSKDPADLIHKTGDFGRILEDGNLEILGRRDQQVKVRGVRVELGEIENLLRGHGAVADVAVVDRDDAEGNKFLVVYVTLTNGTGSDALREYLAERLPRTMLPSAFVELDQLPRTLNGKIDRKALPTLELLQAEREMEAGTLTPLEEIVAGIWCEVLRLPAVGRASNFFNLGGHSLLATQVILRVRDILKVELPIRSIFESPTVGGFAELIAEQISEGRLSAAAPLEPVSREGELPLSFAQQRLWFQEELAHGTTTFHIALGMQLKGQLNQAALEQTFSEVIRRHENLRTSFPVIDGEVVQVISPLVGLALPVVDLQNLGKGEQDTAAQTQAAAEFTRPFDLETGPLLRLVLLRHSQDEHTIICVLHHIISDGWSKGVLMREVSVLYAAFSQGMPSPLPELPVQYADFAAWQRQQLQGDVLNQSLAYWRNNLATAPPLLELPTDRPRPPIQTYRGAMEVFTLSPDVVQQLKALSHQRGVTLFMTLLAAFQTLLFRYTGQQDIVVGTTLANRERSDIEGLIGFFVNMLALRTDCSGDPSFEELLEQVRETTLKAYAHQAVPFEKLLLELDFIKRNPSYSPVFQVVFSFQNQPNLMDLTLTGLKLNFPQPEVTTSQTDLLLDLYDGAAGMIGALHYNTDLFDRSTITRMVEHFQTLLAGVAADAGQRLSELPLLSKRERVQCLLEWNQTDTDYRTDKCIHEIIEQQAAQTPDAAAVVFEAESLSYNELNTRANRLAHHLLAHGVGPENVVGVLMERSTELVSSLFATLKAGAAYLPLDPAYPAERLQLMLEDAGTRVVLTTAELAASLRSQSIKVSHLIEVDSHSAAIERESAENPASGAGADNLAYVIYTSGSTGTPKAAMNTHGAIRNRLLWMQQEYRLGSDDCVLQKTPYSFDVSVWEFFWPLMYGAKLAVARPGGHQDVDYLMDVIEEQQVTTLHFVPSMLSAFLQHEEFDRCRSVRRVIASGEALSAGLIRRFFENMNWAELHNLYGPTEAAVDVSFWNCSSETGPSGRVPIGRPIANTQLYILDGQQVPVAVGVPGELYIGGVAVGRGYLNRPDLTATRFIPDPYGGESGARLYRTGDRVCFSPTGEIEFLGRVDKQVKLRGQRIELGEIETALRKHQSVHEAVVTMRGEGEQARLIAYVVTNAEEAKDLAPTELRTFLQARLPEYMAPSAFVFIEQIPLTANGKINYEALPSLEEAQQDSFRSHTPPRTPQEEILASIWIEVLSLESVGIDENFFDLGGHSLVATRIIHRVNQSFDLDLRMRVMFDEPTIAGLSLLIEEALIEKLEATPEPV